MLFLTESGLIPPYVHLDPLAHKSSGAHSYPTRILTSQDFRPCTTLGEDKTITQNVDTVIGANMCLDKASCTQILGKNRVLFNESLSVAGEDSDFSLRVSKRHGIVYFIPQLRVVHLYRSNVIHFFEDKYSMQWAIYRFLITIERRDSYLSIIPLFRKEQC